MAVDGAPCVGVIDWGIGGFGLVQLLERAAPQVPIAYLSDAGSTPYGLADARQLVQRLHGGIELLADRGATRVVLACNAASTVVDRLEGAPVPVDGIIAAGIGAVPEDLSGTIGVVGGRRTVRGGAYRRALARADRRIISRVAQPLSAHIEAGRTHSSRFERDLRTIVAPLRGSAALVLACTHYPAAAAQFAAALPGTMLIDPAEAMAASIVRSLPSTASSTPTGSRVLLTTGDPAAMAAGARAAWGLELGPVEVVAVG